MRLKDKTVIITGGSEGIGKATAILFAREGAEVLITGRRQNSLIEAQEEAANEGLKIDYRVADVSIERSCIDSVDYAINEFGKIDILFNNAGILYPGIVHTTESEKFQEIFDVNVKGTFMMSKYTIPHMLKNGVGVIVNNSSVVGLKGFAGLSAYSASKGAVTQLTRTMALEYADRGIRVNGICPGTVWTTMVDRFFERAENPKEALSYLESFHPIGRLGYSSEVAYAVLFLCDDNVKFMTGSMVSIDGGWIAN